ncbi:hypothetical protein [Marinobacter sp. SS21]|uniref:hypothetical protein n=1 Tax=Marinobacter sp. SS21 TaxID=2979460 RepID=UPI00232E96AA|nr:hypothetical protein [Marinobacter sp. SS21]MDC0662018.1 hypothetical protein [Marinobacter sp. SS21]
MSKQLTSGLIGLAGALALSASLATPVAAEEVRVPVMTQAERGATNLPRTGQSQAAVRNSYGNPQQISGPVGEPPITQWHYPEFTVYFEYDHVIHSVMKPKR